MASGKTNTSNTPTPGDRALADAVRRLAEAYLPERIYLFGSVARGDAGPHSDYDILVVAPDDAPPERCRSRLAYEVYGEPGLPPMCWFGAGPCSTAGRIWQRRCRPLLCRRGNWFMGNDPALIAGFRTWLVTTSKSYFARATS